MKKIASNPFVFDQRSGAGTAEKVALAVVALQFTQSGELERCLDTLGNDT